MFTNINQHELKDGGSDRKWPEVAGKGRNFPEKFVEIPVLRCVNPSNHVCICI